MVFMTEINKGAITIVKKLKEAGYLAYFAGGWVRDFVMGHPSSDIDIATNAPPPVILDLFSHTILVGLSFGVVIVVIEGHQYEVSTFRKDINYENGRKPTQIELSTPKEDAIRRDFTINGLFFDPITEEIFDYVHGLNDINLQIVRTIGDPFERFFEDRLRMIRAIRFAARFNFHIDLQTQEAIKENAETLFPAVAMERVWQEFVKMSKFPNFGWAISEMHRLNLLGVIFPDLKKIHLNDIRKITSAFEFFPKETPTILYIVRLFPNYTKEEWENLFFYLKISRKDWILIEFYIKAKQAIEKEKVQEDVSLWEWAHLYANDYFFLILQIESLYLSQENKEAFFDVYHKRQKQLDQFVKRIKEKKPILDSCDLLEMGIKPGKNFGVILLEAEKISINQGIETKQELLKLLHPSISQSREHENNY